MNIIKTGALLLCLLSSLAQADTTLFGLTLGKSTRQEAEQTYPPQYKNTQSSLPDSWNYYRVDGKQFNEPQLKYATLYFDDAQTLGIILFTFPSSLEKYKALEEQLSRQYPRIKMTPFVSEPLRLAKTEYQNDTTHVLLDYSDYGTYLSFTDLKYRAAAQKRLAEKKALEANKPKKEP
ncbi:hypothetical protein [Shewanella sp. S23-S33]|uniref:hypothetical protein n=1 Tax=Shewanella sp. S23-S33 TaxID=3342769 RepID=UPI00372D0C05